MFFIVSLVKGLIVQSDQIFHVVDQMPALCQPGCKYHRFFSFANGGAVQDLRFNSVHRYPPL